MSTSFARPLLTLTVIALVGCQSATRIPSTATRAASHAVRTAETATRTTADVTRRVATTVADTIRTPLVEITGPGSDNDAQISNMANAGLLVSHDLNTGKVVVDSKMWSHLSQSDRQTAARIIQRYQNRNIPRPVTITTVSTRHAQASAG